jgi:hypothetical protein
MVIVMVTVMVIVKVMVIVVVMVLTLLQTGLVVPVLQHLSPVLRHSRLPVYIRHFCTNRGKPYIKKSVNICGAVVGVIALDRPTT